MILLLKEKEVVVNKKETLMVEKSEFLEEENVSDFFCMNHLLRFK